MKTTNFIIPKFIFVIFILMSYVTGAQVSIGNVNPDESSMLDIDVSSLGANAKRGILIPRMLTSERTAISNPANGLMVFDTDTNSFWYYSTSWKELSSGSSDLLSDADGDTKIEVENTTDEDKIRFSTANAAGDASVVRMTIDNAGNTRIGDGVNNTYIEADGSLSYEGTATRYDDLRVPVFSTSRDGSNPPDFYWFQDTSGGGGSGSQGVFAYWFSGSTQEEVYFIVQMPHGWKEGTDIYPHVHWSAKTNVGTNTVQWGLEYSWGNVGATIGASTIITGNTPIAAVGSVDAYKHAVTPLGTISGLNKNLSSLLICRLFRDAGSDSYGADAALFEIDFHYQIDSDGSRGQFTK